MIILSGALGCTKPKIKLPDIHMKFGDPVELTLELKGEIFAGIQIPIPDLDGAYIELVPNNPVTGMPGKLILSVPAEQFDNEYFRLKDPLTLPDGRPLPNIVDDKLPAVALQIPEWHNVVFYLGLEVAAVFVPSTITFDPDLQITIPFSDSSGREVGFLTRIPAIDGENGGFFASFNWELAISNPEGIATIHGDDLRYGLLNGKPIDLRKFFKLP